MKTIGLIGGMSWESTVVYYQQLNRLAREKLGGLHSAKILLWSFNFAEIESYQAKGDWEAATQAMVKAAQNLEKGGASCIVICTNTMHKMAETVQNSVNIPLLHIADVTASAISHQGSEKPLLLATRYTMEQDFYKGRLLDKHGINVSIPTNDERTIVHDVIYNELCQGVVKSQSKQQYLDIIRRAVNDGADSVIFGCTEIDLLLSQDELDVPVFNTTKLHAEAAMNFALS